MSCMILAHSFSLTGMTDSRDCLTRSHFAKAGSALIWVSGNCFANSLAKRISTATALASFLVGSGIGPLTASAKPTGLFLTRVINENLIARHDCRKNGTGRSG